MRLAALRFLCVSAITLCCPFVNAAEPVATPSTATQPANKFPLPEMEEFSGRLAVAVEALGRGEVQRAIGLFEQELPKPLETDDNPFSVDLRSAWLREVAVFAATKPSFESVELVGRRPVSKQSQQLIYIGNGSNGPVLITFNVFQYQGRWQMVGFGFHMGWKQIVEDDRYERFAQPYTYAFKLKETVLRSAENKSKVDSPSIKPAAFEESDGSVPAPKPVEEFAPLKRLPTLQQRSSAGDEPIKVYGGVR